MGLAEDLKALQELREKGELTQSAYESARDATMRKHGVAPGGGSQPGRAMGKYVLVLLGGILVVILGLHAVDESTKGPTSGATPQAYSQPTIPFISPQPHAATITNSALTVSAHAISWYSFSVPPNATNVVVDGHFTATGGIGNDIIVYITDDDGLANLKNGHEARVWYNSQKATQSAIHTVLPNTPGTYYLVFDNLFSLLTPKAVEVNATLNYMQ